MWCRIAFAFAVAVLMPGADGMAQPSSMRWSGPWDMIAFEVRSWGSPVTSWRLLADGSGSWTEAVRDDGAPLGDYRLVWHEFAAGADGYRQVATILARLPDTIPDYADCANRMTDLPYGTIRLTRGATTVEVAWNSGCLDDSYRAFVATLKDADTAVAAWGRAGRIIRTEGAIRPAAPP